MIRNNQNGRRRGRGGARPPQGGGPSGNYGNNNGGGSRIDTRQRGNATQLLEKYKAMARDATQNGDRVQAEFYMQYADHYFRVLNEFRARDPQPAPRPSYDDDDDGYGASVGQNYAAASDRDEDEEEPTAERGNGTVGNGNGERPAYRTGGERPRNDTYAGHNDRNRDPRQDRARDAGQRVPSAGDGDDGGDGARRDVGRTQTARYDNGRDVPRYENGRADGPRRAESGDAARRYGGRDEVGDSGRRDSTRDDTRPPAPSDARRRDYVPSGREGHDAGSAGAGVPDGSQREPERRVEPVIGLPGPATLAPTFAAEPAASSAAADETPAPRKRGRPRKVVITDSVDG